MAFKKKAKTLQYGDLFTPDMIAYYQTHIIEFVEDLIFQNKDQYNLSAQQKDLLLSIQNNKRTAAKSGKGIGKTATISYAILWFLCCFDSPKVICTAPSYPTLKSALWPEVAKWLLISAVKDIFTHTEDKLYLTECPKNWFCEPRTAKERENLQGLHSDNMLIIVDEASGMKQDIYEALDTTLTSVNNKICLIGNPTQVSGPFFEAFNKFKSRWCTKTYSAIESPHVNREQISYYEEKYGIHHDLYLVNILGEFPEGSPDAFIKLSDVHAAVQRSNDLFVNSGDIEIGIDVARFGDDSTVLYWRQGMKVYPAKTMAKNSIPEAVDLVLKTVREIRAKTGYEKTIKVKIDDSGLGGAVTDYLALDRDHNIDAVPCNFGGKGSDMYFNETSIMWGKVKDHIGSMCLPDDKYLIEELSSRRWKLQNGKIAIEPKALYKKEFKKSPDRADALCLCFATKSNEKCILKTFDPLDSNTVKRNLNYIGDEKIGSIFYTKDLKVCINYSAWDGNKLYIYDEFITDDSFVYVVLNLNQHQPLSKILGNDVLFSNGKDDLSFKYRKYGINIRQNYTYNELAAIETLSNMVMSKRLLIDDKCINTIQQLKDWKIDQSRIDQERQFGLCFALCNTVGDLKKKVELLPSNIIRSPYQETKQVIKDDYLYI